MDDGFQPGLLPDSFPVRPIHDVRNGVVSQPAAFGLHLQDNETECQRDLLARFISVEFGSMHRRIKRGGICAGKRCEALLPAIVTEPLMQCFAAWSFHEFIGLG